MSDDEDAREFERLQNEVRELKALAAQPWSSVTADHAEEEEACSSGYEDDDLDSEELDDEEEGQPRPTEPMQASGNVGWPPVLAFSFHVPMPLPTDLLGFINSSLRLHSSG